MWESAGEEMSHGLNIRCWVGAGWSVVGSAAHSYARLDLDSDGVCLSWVEIGWHCVCVGLAWGGPGGNQPIDSGILSSSLAEVKSAMATDITPGLR